VIPRSPPAIVPHKALLAAANRFGGADQRFAEQTQMVPGRVKVHLARGRQQRMSMDDYDLPSQLLRQFLQPLEQIEFFRDEQLLTESSDLFESRSLTKHERSRRPFCNSAQNIPSARDQASDHVTPFQFHSTSTGEAFARLDRSRHGRKQLRARNRIRIDEYEPIAGSDRSSAISRPANLVDRLEQNAGSRRPRQFSGVVGRIIVTNDQFTVPSQLMKCRSSRFDALQRRTDQFFLVKGRNNNRDFHEAK